LSLLFLRLEGRTLTYRAWSGWIEEGGEEVVNKVRTERQAATPARAEEANLSRQEIGGGVVVCEDDDHGPSSWLVPIVVV
jgi:hypothetical protein